MKPTLPPSVVAPVFGDLDTYLTEFAPDMAARVNTGFDALFDPEREPLSDEVLALKRCKMVPYPAQAVAVEAIIRAWRKRSTVWCVGEMGTGKTAISLWAIRAWEQKLGRPVRVVLTAPNQLVRKWKKHAETILPGCRAVIVKSWRDLLRLTEESVTQAKLIHTSTGTVEQEVRRRVPPSCTEIYILPRDRGKLGYAWRNTAIVREKITTTKSSNGSAWKFRDTFLACPICFGQLTDAEGHPIVTLSGGKRAKMTCQCTSRQQHSLTKHSRESEYETPCRRKNKRDEWIEEPTWQAFNGRPGKLTPAGTPMPKTAPRRVPPCALLRQIGLRFDFYISDEVHELKGGGTLQGQMLADLAKISDRQLLLTGTLTGGYADNLLHLLWRTIPSRMADDGMKHSESGHEDFVKMYGVLQIEKRYRADKKGDYADLAHGRGKLRGRRVKSLPGISPVLFTNFLLDQCVFIRLQEMHAHLPGFHERVHVVPITAEQDRELYRMQEDFKSHVMDVPKTKAWSAARNVFLRWVDKPWIEPFEVTTHDELGNLITAFDVPQLEKIEYPKERRLRRLVQRNMLRGRKTWIFTELAGRGHADKGGSLMMKPKWDVMEHYEQYLASFGIRAKVLRSQADGGPKPEAREDWIAEHAPNVDVIISNPSLVQTGLDLFQFPSIIFAYCGYSTYVLRQASRRAWRLGQTLDCEVDYIVAGTPRGGRSKSVQDAALSLMAQKMESSLAIEGEFSSEGLAAMAESEDMASKLAKFIDGRLDSVESSRSSFARYREKLEEAMPDLAKVTATTALTAAPAPVVTTQDEISQKASARKNGICPPRKIQKTDRPMLPAPSNGHAAESTRSPRKPLSQLDEAKFHVWRAAQRATTHTINGVVYVHASGSSAVAYPEAEFTDFDAMREFWREHVRDAVLPPPPAPKPTPVSVAPTSSASVFERASGIHKSEPDSIRERRELRLSALKQCLGEPVESSGDRHRFANRGWVQLVAKHRSTVRERNFAALVEQHPDALIAFVEPAHEVGPTTSTRRVTVNEIEYVVSTMPAASYMAGERTPANP